MINMAFMPLYMWEMWDVTPVTHEHTDGRTVESRAVFSLNWIRNWICSKLEKNPWRVIFARLSNYFDGWGSPCARICKGPCPATFFWYFWYFSVFLFLIFLVFFMGIAEEMAHLLPPSAPGRKRERKIFSKLSFSRLETPLPWHEEMSQQTWNLSNILHY